MKKSKRPIPKSLRAVKAVRSAPLPASMKSVGFVLADQISNSRPDWDVWGAIRTTARAAGLSPSNVQIAFERFETMGVLTKTNRHELQRDGYLGRPSVCYTFNVDVLERARPEDVPANPGSRRRKAQPIPPVAGENLVPVAGENLVPVAGAEPQSVKPTGERLRLNGGGDGEAVAALAQGQDPISAQVADTLRAEVEALLTGGLPLTEADRLETEAWLHAHPARDRIPVPGGAD